MIHWAGVQIIQQVCGDWVIFFPLFARLILSAMFFFCTDFFLFTHISTIGCVVVMILPHFQNKSTSINQSGDDDFLECYCNSKDRKNTNRNVQNIVHINLLLSVCEYDHIIILNCQAFDVGDFFFA